jgi:malate dehydrogenase (oxaloacetate-decarboxylating)(NADP+)
VIEQALRERMKIPVMHDDQHGTAIISAAGLINACMLTNRKLEDIKVVVNGAGAAALACTSLIKSMGVRHENVIVCDRDGPIYRGREKPVNQWQSAHAIDTDARTLEQALKGADVFLGLSAAGALPAEYVKEMAPEPIIFAMANPVPEITPPEAKAARPDCIIATGRSDFPIRSTMCWASLHLPRGAGRARHRHQRRDEDCRGQCHRRTGAPTGA